MCVYIPPSAVTVCYYMTLICHNTVSDVGFQGQGAMKHGARGKKQTLKSQSTDLGTTDVGTI